MSWPIKKLGEVTKEIIGGGTPRRNNLEYWNGDIPWMTVDDINGNFYIVKTKQFISKKGLENSNAKIVPPHSVILSCTASVGNVAINKIPLTTNQQFNSFICSDEIIPEFLAYILILKKRIIESLGGITTFPFISKSIIAKLKIPLPPLAIQIQIVERLDKIAEAQKLNDALIQKTDELFQSLFYNEYEVKNNQWDSKKLQEICEKIDQVHPKKMFKKEFLYIDIASINNDKVIRAQIVSVDRAPSRARKVVKAGDTIFSTVRPYLKHIAYIPEMLDNSIASTGFCVIRPNADLVNTFFLNYVVESDHFVRKVLPFQRGANYPAVSDKNIYDIKISLPSLKAQKQIVAKLSAVQDYKKQLLEQKSKLKELFDSSLAKSMRN